MRHLDREIKFIIHQAVTYLCLFGSRRGNTLWSLKFVFPWIFGIFNILSIRGSWDTKIDLI